MTAYVALSMPIFLGIFAILVGYKELRRLRKINKTNADKIHKELSGAMRFAGGSLAYGGRLTIQSIAIDTAVRKKSDELAEAFGRVRADTKPK
jgi:hypothetical protein